MSNPIERPAPASDPQVPVTPPERPQFSDPYPRNTPPDVVQPRPDTIEQPASPVIPERPQPHRPS